MRQILLIMIGLSISLWADFTRDYSTNIVTDNATGLQWQDDSNITKAWTQAIDYCENNVSLGGHADWRLPNFNELYSITDKSKRNPAINNVFKNVVSGGYWSSSTVVGGESTAWYVGFGGGNGYWGNKSSSYYVRCVRDGQ